MPNILGLSCIRKLFISPYHKPKLIILSTIWHPHLSLLSIWRLVHLILYLNCLLPFLILLVKWCTRNLFYKRRRSATNAKDLAQFTIPIIIPTGLPLTIYLAAIRLICLESLYTIIEKLLCQDFHTSISFALPKRDKERNGFRSLAMHLQTKAKPKSL